MRDLPTTNEALSNQIKLLDATLDEAERLLQKKEFETAGTNLDGVWRHRYAVAKNLCIDPSDMMILDLRKERHRRLMNDLNWSGGLLRRILRRIM
jgi:hypothetical protein